MKSALLRTGSIPVQTLNRNPSLNGSACCSPKISFRSENSGFNKIRRSNSDTELNRSELMIMSSRLNRLGSVSFPIIAEEELAGGFGIGIGTGTGNGKGNNYGGKGKGGSNNNNNNNGNEKGSSVGEYYQQMLKSNPGDSLLLRNYGKYLHEVEKNVEKAEECYGRAILASPGDGELLSLYGNLIWETSKDEDRAQLYYDQALLNSPDVSF
ncbi:rho GTPase-activating protein gacK-like isoform X2 [Chenopodium quinoa]|uniref:rho GTPase-activating protein gacK-like isoform X2 n=1 Tax=Chenopodium quinoa TaxID=63459 RepID=UPI000B7898FE|nr:rho GTPase-activating protein gacK-like isoform X2 [Chenopodium quinoa]